MAYAMEIIKSVPTLAHFVHSSNEATQLHAARTLVHIANGTPLMRRAVLQTDVVSTLLAVSSPQLVELAMTLQRHLQRQQAHDLKLAQLAYVLSPFPTLSGMTSDKESEQTAAIEYLKDLCSDKLNTPIQNLLTNGHLIEELFHVILTSSDESLQV
jgi:hypothetical protein